MFFLLITCLLGEPTGKPPVESMLVVDTCPIPIFRMLSQGLFICSLEFQVRGTGDGVAIVVWKFPEPMGMIAQEKKFGNVF